LKPVVRYSGLGDSNAERHNRIQSPKKFWDQQTLNTKSLGPLQRLNCQLDNPIVNDTTSHLVGMGGWGAA